MIDLRGLDPPEPIIRVFDALALGDGPHVFLLPRSPAPLYAMLRREGWRHSERLVPEGFEVTVWRGDDIVKPETKAGECCGCGCRSESVATETVGKKSI